MTIAQILLGHVSPETAYLVPDYPYGRVVRCRIRYWIEFKASQGFRFMAQTENPKTLQWNKPKASTYQPVAGAMYLDENGHVKWEGLHYGADAKEVLAFVQNFPGADFTVIREIIQGKLKYHAHHATATHSRRGVQTDLDRERHSADYTLWKEVEMALAETA